MTTTQVHAYRDPVPNQPRTPNRSVRIDDPKWEGLALGAELTGTNRPAVINALVAWWLGCPGAELPVRPDPETLERLRRGEEPRA